MSTSAIYELQLLAINHLIVGNVWDHSWSVILQEKRKPKLSENRELRAQEERIKVRMNGQSFLTRNFILSIPRYSARVMK
jgi:hypothetical protein